MRLLLVIPNITSFDSFLTGLADTLMQQGHEVHCACSTKALWGKDTHPVLPPDRIHDLSFPRGMNPISHLKAARQLSDLVSQIQPNLIHAHFSSAIFTTALAKRNSWPITIGTFQGVSFLLIGGIKHELLKVTESWASSRLNKIWVLTDDDVAGLRRYSPKACIYKQKALGFGCDLERFDMRHISSATQETLRNSLGIQDQHFVFTFVGRFVHFKGFDTTIRSFIKLVKDYPQARLLLVGDYDSLHSSGLSENERSVLNKTAAVINVGWQARVEEYLAITDVFVFPSYREGIPVCIMEALSMGKPVITLDTRGCRDVVRDTIDGIVVREGAPDGVFLAMRELLENQQLKQDFAAQALAERKKFSRNNYVQEQINIYQELLSEAVLSDDTL